jgi:uncharacterized membrane protein YgdD (TMEM256/DUF423 family)
MPTTQPWISRVSAVTGALAVAMGAYAQHSITDAGPRELIRTGAIFALTHAAAAFAVEARAPWASLCLAGGGLLFSASLYYLALGAPPLVGAITPVGGILMIAGWLLAGWAGLRAR